MCDYGACVKPRIISILIVSKHNNAYKLESRNDSNVVHKLSVPQITHLVRVALRVVKRNDDVCVEV